MTVGANALLTRMEFVHYFGLIAVLFGFIMFKWPSERDVVSEDSWHCSSKQFVTPKRTCENELQKAEHDFALKISDLRLQHERELNDEKRKCETELHSKQLQHVQQTNTLLRECETEAHNKLREHESIYSNIRIEVLELQRQLNAFESTERNRGVIDHVLLAIKKMLNILPAIESSLVPGGGLLSLISGGLRSLFSKTLQIAN